MKFWYSPARTRSPETNDENIILRPIIPVLVYGENEAGLYSALVDTGADNTFLPRRIADDLHIELQSCQGPSPVAFGGGRVETFFADVPLQISDGEEDITWNARVLFFDTESSQDEVVVLGHQGFLSFFTSVFDGDAGTLELFANDTLPAAG